MSFKDMYFTEEPFSRQCSQCDETFRRVESFHVHKSCYPADMRRGKQVRCSDCSYMGSDLQSVRQHFRTKHVPKMFTCIVPVTSSAVCGEKYATKQLVMNHVEKHFRHMQGDTGKTRKRKKRTAAACETETDDSSDDSDECEVPSQKSERIPVSTKSSVPATTNTRPPAVADTQPQNDLLRISINELLDRLSHCSDCNGYFVTKEDLLQHYFAHTQVPDDGSTDSDVDAKQEPGVGVQNPHPEPQLVSSLEHQSLITLD